MHVIQNQGFVSRPTPKVSNHQEGALKEHEVDDLNMTINHFEL